MTELVKQPTSQTVRKVQWSATTAAIAAPFAASISYPLADLIVSFLPVWQSAEAFAAVSLLLELLLTGLLTGIAAWGGGWAVKARAEDVGA
jgi:hypothetical protein